MLRFLAAILILFVNFGVANAATLVENNFNWSVYTAKKDDKSLCYMVSSPQKSYGDYNSRGDAYMMVAMRDKAPEISVVSGYEYKPKSNPAAEFFKYGTYQFMTRKNLAWLKNDNNQEMITAMKKDNTVRFHAHSELGTESIDEYSLKGFSKSYSLLLRGCKK